MIIINIKVMHSIVYLFSITFPSLVNAAGGISFDISRTKIPTEDTVTPITNPYSYDVVYKRQYQEYHLENEKYFYMIQFKLGTPAQETIGVTIDTGSSDLWVSSKSSALCEKVGCEAYGTFDSDASSTWKYNNSEFSITYADKTYAKGDWGMDTIHIGDISVPNFNFALATDSDSSFGVFGIGFSTLESSPNPYINFPGALVAKGLTNSQAYSLFLNSKEADSGTILFGAVDHSKYTGSLTTIPIISKYRTSVHLTGLSYSNDDDDGDKDLYVGNDAGAKNDGFLTDDGLYALLDSGTTLSMLPEGFVHKIGKTFDATFDDGSGLYLMSCNSDESQIIDFKFSCITIKAPLSNFLESAYLDDGTAAFLPNGEPMCFLAFIPTSDIPILGDSFLRAAYVVFDLDNHQVSIAQAALDPSSTSDIEEIQVGPDGVPKTSKCGVTSSFFDLSFFTSLFHIPSPSSSSDSSSLPTPLSLSGNSFHEVGLPSSEQVLPIDLTTTEFSESTLTETICTRDECTDNSYSTTIEPTSVSIETISTTIITFSCETHINEYTTEVITISFTTVVPCSTSSIETVEPQVLTQVKASTIAIATSTLKSTLESTLEATSTPTLKPTVVTSITPPKITTPTVPTTPNIANSLNSLLPSSVHIGIAIILFTPFLTFI